MGDLLIETVAGKSVLQTSRSHRERPDIEAHTRSFRHRVQASQGREEEGIKKRYPTQRSEEKIFLSQRQFQILSLLVIFLSFYRTKGEKREECEKERRETHPVWAPQGLKDPRVSRRKQSCSQAVIQRMMGVGSSGGQDHKELWSSLRWIGIGRWFSTILTYLVAQNPLV